jgi:hypothetical protein
MQSRRSGMWWEAAIEAPDPGHGQISIQSFPDGPSHTKHQKRPFLRHLIGRCTSCSSRLPATSLQSGPWNRGPSGQ